MASLEDKRADDLQILRHLLRPLVKFGLKRALSIQDLVKCLKVVLVDVASEEIKKSSPKVNLSRVTVMTGIYREEVARILYEKQLPSEEPQSILTRVIGQWEQDPRFTSKDGEPRVLSCEGDKNEFYRLVDSVSRNVNPASVLFEIQRNGAAERTPRGLKLIRQTFAIGSDRVEGYKIAARDLDALLSAVEENVEHPEVVGQLHLHTEYDNVYVKNLPQIKRWLIKEAKAFHKKARAFISKFDKDIDDTQDPNEPAGGRVILGAFSMTELPPLVDTGEEQPVKTKPSRGRSK